MKSNHIAKSLKYIFNQTNARKRPVPMIWGPPGVGKSQVVAQVAKELYPDSHFFDIRLLLLDAVDLRGVPHVDKENNEAIWSIPQFLPKKRHGDCVLFLDEINAAPPMIQAATYQLILDRKLGEYELPDGVRIVAAGNRDKDRAVTNRMGTAMGTRLLHLDFDVDHEAWCEWAAGAGIRPECISYIRFRPDNLHKFGDAEKNSRTFPTPRGWEGVSNVLDLNIQEGLIEAFNIAGRIGDDYQHDFAGFLKICRELPDLDDVIKNPTKYKIPKDPSIQYAMIGGLAHRTTKQNISKVLEFIDMFPKEFKVLFWKDARSRNLGLNETKEYTAFFTKKENRDIVFSKEE
jgi:MoxR-like ATPase